MFQHTRDYIVFLNLKTKEIKLKLLVVRIRLGLRLDQLIEVLFSLKKENCFFRKLVKNLICTPLNRPGPLGGV